VLRDSNDTASRYLTRRWLFGRMATVCHPGGQVGWPPCSPGWPS